MCLVCFRDVLGMLLECGWNVVGVFEVLGMF